MRVPNLASRMTTLSLVWIGLATTAVGAGPTVIEPDEMLRLAGELLRTYPHLLSNDLKTRLDELNREGREAVDRVHRAERSKNNEQRAGAIRRRDEVAGQLATALEQWPGLVRLDLDAQLMALPAVGPLEFPAEQGALLLRITPPAAGSPAPGTHALVRAFDLVGPDSTDWKPLQIDVLADGPTLLLLGLSHLPKGRIHQRVDIKVAAATYHLPLELRTSEPGRLKLTILSEETHQPTPAMVRLVWKLNGQPRRLPNAVEIKGQFDNLGRVSSERNLQVPGRMRGDYWVVPGPTDVELPAGEWELTARRGVEHLSARETFKIEPGQTLARTLTIARWVDMRKMGWYSGDDHVHCQMLSDDDAQRLMTYAQAEDVHLVNVVKMGDVFRTWFEQRGFGPEYRVVDGDRILSPGQECPRTHDQLGHTISMNIKRMVRDTDKYFLYDWVFDAVHADGGLSGYAHTSSGMFNVHRDMAVNIPRGKIDFAEVLQFAQLGTDLWYRFLNAGFKVTASAGSDIPWGGTMGEVRVFAQLGGAPFTADAWFEAVRRGRTFVSNGPMLEFTVDDALPGDELAVNANRKLRVKARAWGDPGAVLPARLEIVRHGEVIHSIEATPGQKELTIDIQVDAAHGFWVAAHAVGTEG